MVVAHSARRPLPCTPAQFFELAFSVAADSEQGHTQSGEAHTQPGEADGSSSSSGGFLGRFHAAQGHAAARASAWSAAAPPGGFFAEDTHDENGSEIEHEFRTVHFTAPIAGQAFASLIPSGAGVELVEVQRVSIERGKVVCLESSARGVSGAMASLLTKMTIRAYNSDSMSNVGCLCQVDISCEYAGSWFKSAIEQAAKKGAESAVSLLLDMAESEFSTVGDFGSTERLSSDDEEFFDAEDDEDAWQEFARYSQQEQQEEYQQHNLGRRRRGVTDSQARRAAHLRALHTLRSTLEQLHSSVAQADERVAALAAMRSGANNNLSMSESTPPSSSVPKPTEHRLRDLATRQRSEASRMVVASEEFHSRVDEVSDHLGRAETESAVWARRVVLALAVVSWPLLSRRLWRIVRIPLAARFGGIVPRFLLLGE